MWYFTWILGVCLAGGCGILNAMWFEMHCDGELTKIDKQSNEHE